MPSRKVAIIGSGAGGLISASVLRKSGFDVTIYERNDFIGGVWNYQEPLPPVNSSLRSPKSNPMYQGLRTNLPKEIMAFNFETPFPDHLPSFITHHNVKDYLIDFYIKNCLTDCIYLSTEVTECIPTDDVIQLTENELNPAVPPQKAFSSSWLVKSRSLITNTTNCELFDYVVVCNGHYNEPFVPSENIENSDLFKGKQIHSREYNTPTEFAGQRVLVVGARSSGTDIARELNTCMTVSAVHVSDRNFVREQQSNNNDSTSITSDGATTTAYVNSDTASRIMHHSGIRRFIANTNQLEFHDDSVAEVDVVIWCTGFLYHYPFLTASCFRNNDNSMLYQRTRKVCSLYQQLFFIPRPSLAFIGLPWAVVPFPLFYIQALTVSEVFRSSENVSLLPSQAAMYEWLQEFEATMKKTSFTSISGISSTSNASNNPSSDSFTGASTNVDDGKYHYLGVALQFDYMLELLAWADKADSNHIQDKQNEGKEDSLLLRNYETLKKYLQLLQEIHAHVTQNRPSFVGAADTYRNYQYQLDRNLMEWTVVIPDKDGGENHTKMNHEKVVI